MSSFPPDAKINNNLIYHEGNHDERGNPHNQYVPKIPTAYITTNGANDTNKYIKMFSITYTPNTQIDFYYRFNIIGLKQFEVTGKNDYHILEVNIPFSGAIQPILIRHDGTSTLVFYGITTSNADGTTTLDIYAKITVSYKQYFVKMEVARADNIVGYLDLYAYRCLTVDCKTIVSSITATINQTIVNKLTTTQYTTTAFTLTANSESLKIINTITGISSNSAVIVTPNYNFPTGSWYMISITPGNLYIKFMSKSGSDIPIPDIVWNIAYISTT